ncbi:MAG: heat-inducible transcriptional repressor HrcA [Verrucomicrobia bacterium]|nr:heat-inducible transcriptional repressor HrcA [Verrucomicrobiota bacterium]
MKSFLSKKPTKDEREKQVLLSLVELYLRTGKPVGSQTLKENGFDHLSPATLRNYFVKLEETGFLKQQHSSGGRIPTSLAYKTYAEFILPSSFLEEKEQEQLIKLLSKETREVHLYLQRAAEILSDLAQGAVFLSSPRFDQDFILDIKLLSIDIHRVLCVLVTDFGTVRSEILFTEKKLSAFNIKRIEQFFHWKITGLDKPKLLPEEEITANKFYNEILLRHVVNYSSFSFSDILKTGFSKMLQYPDFNDASSLASGLALFENDQALRALLSDCSEKKDIKFWIGEDLHSFSSGAATCSVLAVPYYIHNTAVGSIAILCPSRAPYKKLFATLKTISEVISSSLTKSLYKFKISYRQPKIAELEINKQTTLLSFQKEGLMLEDQTQKEP